MIQDEQPHFPGSTKQEIGKRRGPLCITLICIRRSGLQSSSPGWRHINFPLGPENISLYALRFSHSTQPALLC